MRTPDGVDLYVEQDGPADSPVTVVFSHGFTAELGEFLLQREALRSRARLVFYDQRGHGRSAKTGYRHATIDQLGRDLQQVLEGLPGPIVLVGHSMGGMALMSWARQFPEEVGSRVVGAFLLATSASDLVTAGPLGAFVKLATRMRMLPFWFWLIRLSAPAVSRIRRPGTRLGYRWIRHYLFGTEDADDVELVQLVQAMLESCDARTSAAFYPTFITHDETSALPVLARIPTTVLCGTKDRLTPISHSRAMAAELGPLCELIEVPGCGHSVNVTRPALVDQAILDLVHRAVSQREAASRERPAQR